MHTTVRNKRIEVLAKIDALKDKCRCQSSEESKSCANCKELNTLGNQLTQLLKLKKNGFLETTVNKDIHSKDFNFKVPFLRVGKRTTYDWSNHHGILVENSNHFTVGEMAEKLGVSSEILKAYYKRQNLQHKPNVDKGKKYEYLVDGKIIATGSIKSIAKQTGESVHSLRSWRNITGRNGKKVVAIE